MLCQPGKACLQHPVIKALLCFDADAVKPFFRADSCQLLISEVTADIGSEHVSRQGLIRK